LSEVSIHYDPMIAKLAVWGRTRNEAIDRLRRALDEYEVAGITTTLPFFREIVRDQEFIDARLDTGFISRFNERQTRPQISAEDTDLAIIAAALHYSKHQPIRVQNAVSKWKLSARETKSNHR